MDNSSNEFKEIDKPIKRIFLWGMMGVGKTKTAKSLAKKIGWHFIDTDEFIEIENGMSIEKIFSQRGEEHFRILERKAIKQLIQREFVVISTGGGMPCFSNNADVMNNAGLTIWLDGSANFLASRLIDAKKKRPLLSNINSKAELIEFLYEIKMKRELYYQKAHWRADAMNLNLNLLAEKLSLSEE